MAVHDIGRPMLTDDEIVAVCVRLDTGWRTPLPTVELEDPERAAAAVMRGSRSLYVRGLLDADADRLDEVLLSHVRGITERPVRLAVYAADGSGEPVPGSPAQFFFAHPTEDRWACDAVSAGGVHTFGDDDATSVRADALRAIGDVLSGGVQGYDDPSAVLVLISESGDGVRQLEVATGRMRASVTVDAGSRPGPTTALAPQAALDWLLGDPAGPR